MAKTGPAPKDPSQLQGHYSAAKLAGDDWEEIDPDKVVEAPEIPDWIDASPRAVAIYEYLTSLPQSQLYGAGTYFELWMSLPLIERYLSRPGGETYKTLVSTLGTALRLTEDDMAKARIRMVKADEQTDDPSETSEQNARVIAMKERRNRLKGA
ncbi:hypothetical protein HOT75_gp011 [Gordonia phage Daredevil]|uniref:Uncharacterized protein n=1 Tax=Gordonia phage Daredevil TaxID=2283286 RepID=A0A345MIL8_9CAUD|nr:hypothetical protein HOT75_gp011 [Gordonia phage Daredevil]AXH70399.1 hypothetical protein SEA_DAREDEVIL_11 [Gordonia phage Daredevil]